MQEYSIDTEPKIIALHGPIKHGKSTMAAILQDLEPKNLYYESSMIISEVLDKSHDTLRQPFSKDRFILINELLSKLPPILKQVVHVAVEPEALQFNQDDAVNNPRLYEKLLEHAGRLQKMPELANNKVTPENKEYYRAGLQGIGGYLVSKVSPTIWYDEIIRRSHNDRTEDTNLIIVGGLRFPADAEVIRDAGGYIAEISRPSATQPDLNDPTEAYRRLISNDTKIINNGDIDTDLFAVGKALYADLISDSLKKYYVADSINT